MKITSNWLKDHLETKLIQIMENHIAVLIFIYVVLLAWLSLVY